MPPDRLARGHPVTGDDLFAAALLLRVEQIAADRERRPAWPDGPPPQLHRWRLRPVGRELRTVNHPVARRPTETRPFRTPRRRCGGGCHPGGPAPSRVEGRVGCRRERFLRQLRCDRIRSAGLGFVGGQSEQPLLGRRRPPPVEIRSSVGVDATGPHHHPRQTSEHDGPDCRSGASSRRETAAHRRPCDQRQAQCRYRQDVTQVAHRGAGDRRMDDRLLRDQHADHQHDRAQPLVPARAAEHQPPHDHDQRAAEGPEHRQTRISGLEDGDDVSGQDEEDRGGHPGP